MYFLSRVFLDQSMNYDKHKAVCSPQSIAVFIALVLGNQTSFIIYIWKAAVEFNN